MILAAKDASHHILYNMLITIIAHCTYEFASCSKMSDDFSYNLTWRVRTWYRSVTWPDCPARDIRLFIGTGTSLVHPLPLPPSLCTQREREWGRSLSSLLLSQILLFSATPATRYVFDSSFFRANPRLPPHTFVNLISDLILSRKVEAFARGFILNILTFLCFIYFDNNVQAVQSMSYSLALRVRRQQSYYTK